MLRALLDRPGVGEAAILQTCNRSEVYLYAKRNTDWAKAISEAIEQVNPAAVQVWGTYCRQQRGIEAARHLFTVAAGLDSQMLGENQILSQVKAAYLESIECYASRFVFHRLFHTAFQAGKAVRMRTDISGGAVSISLAAVELAKEKVKLDTRAVMIIGAGENAELAARYLIKQGVGGLIIANRNKSHAEELCRRLGKGRAIPLSGIAGAMREVDLVIASTGSDRPVVNYEDVEKVLRRRRRPILMIDIAVPRDIDERIGEFGCVSIVNIDDLDQRIVANKKKRSSEIPRAEKIVDDFTGKFADWLDSLAVVPAVARLTQRATEMARAEARRYAKHFGLKNAKKLETFAESLTRKLLHGPVSFLKGSNHQEPSSQQLRSLDLVNKMFLLDDEVGQ